MNEENQSDNNKIKEKWVETLGALWPAIKGSLAQVRKPCIRKNCRACASGKKHLAWMLSVVKGRRRSTLYVPAALAPQIKQAIRNGHKIEELLQKAAIQMVDIHRQERAKTKK